MVRVKGVVRVVGGLGVVALLAALTAGCNDGRSRPRGTVASGVAPVATGVVGQLTGDRDDQVSPQLQLLVARAIQLGPTDAPLDF